MTGDAENADTPDNPPPEGARRFVIGAHAYEAPRPESALYIVSTPIGNLGDITVRALEVLAAADLVACEDTRVTATLMQRFALRAQLLPYHEHNAERQRPRLLAALDEGKVVALVSDAGTPLVSDPGYRLVAEVIEAGHRIIPVPGASALLAALVGAGLPSDTVLFAGFLPQKGGARARRLAELADVPATLVFYESPHRLAASLETMADVLGAERRAAVARELTKRFETFERGSLSHLRDFYAGETVKGEIVVVVAPPAPRAEADSEDADALLAEALTTMKPAAAAKQVSRQTGLDRKVLYAKALAMKGGGDT
ncbi:16S rRNA (cytidine(1402)-2'-O)-methyltransferase [Stappia sp. F7233]|uniref:Ribosomal RNA small subunit methyltransferase I n=1 Tax=Stappia albiluteola TaxID=2758565 RepID=A0A839AID8_9HYPH|nr:16S rRNA (cytidine(1402)-2'-O)-methyltransferase [Stappia albiluteola]MBA5778788.1 16S rRNA (cytidine(1402)-2'-O)-methyltransferase [Stappia albiluteola]